MKRLGKRRAVCMEKEQKLQAVISVVMPVHNAEKYIIQAIESVYRQQGDFPIELYVVDDASTDGTRQRIEDWRRNCKSREKEFPGCCPCELIYLKNECNLGVAETRNRAIRMARGNISRFWTRTTGGGRTSLRARWS